ncbi:dnaJ homolog dnj-5-like [Tripterygium wilfordii]|uniref:dnaJ homolog dnj-5-like n=1 Tax=Tripterygium wilfordii TaxID=458696 RepID=UPI0018F8563A|nr:dnaJ homolog dnj-5-like [Tripterygium wilfordii]XP_038721655.1 dnaJ homolog dnj-5-like [Tripterygium wilfordii]
MQILMVFILLMQNLYVILSNSKGSTVAPPTTVQSSVLLAVGNTPSMPRLKQLAQTITGSHSRTLGLNNTVFGRVKQVRLSSILQHSLHGGDGSDTSVSPSPAPLPYPHPHPHHHHHHHYHHHHSHDVQLAPAVAPAPAPTIEKTTPPPWKVAPPPQKSNEAKHPACQNGNRRRVPGKAKKQSHLTPAIAPYISPHYSAPSEPHVNSLSTAPVSSSIPLSSPLPNVVFAHVQPPSSLNPYEGYSDKRPSVSPSPFPSSASAGFHPSDGHFHSS